MKQGWRGNLYTKIFWPCVGPHTNGTLGLQLLPFVTHENWFKMWYISGVSWNKIGEQYEPVYVIKYARSFDGIFWTRYTNVCIEPKNDMEAFSNPTVINKNGAYHMWYCYRGSADYRGGRAIVLDMASLGTECTLRGWMIRLAFR